MNLKKQFEQIEEIWSPEKIKQLLDQRQEEEFVKNNLNVNSRRFSDREIKIIRKKVCDLPSGELVVIYLRFWEGIGIREISKKLCLPKVLVLQYLEKALIRLKSDFAFPTEIYLQPRKLKCA